jgi:mono/diheme cytochrome c family protein
VQKSLLLASFTGALTGLLVAVMVAIGIAYTGAYNVAATEEHTSAVRWLFDTTFRNSVQARAAKIRPPENYTPEMIAAGASDYKLMSQHCHSGPGIEREKWAEGMRPNPPRLKDAAKNWKPNEVFWIIKYGAKMSGMPAFGPTHEDKELWNIAAFVSQLPAITSQEYVRMSGDHSDTNQGKQSSPKEIE